MKRLFSPILFTAAVPSPCRWPRRLRPRRAGRPTVRRINPPAPSRTAAAHRRHQAASDRPAASGAPPRRQAAGTPPPVPLPQWFVEIDTDKKGEVTRAEFLKYRMNSFEELDTNKDGKLSLEEFLKVAEPPFSQGRARRAVARGAPQPRAGRVPEPRHQSRRLRRARRGRGAGPFRVQPVRHGPRQQGDRARGAPDRAALAGARGRRAPADRGAAAPGHGRRSTTSSTCSCARPTSSTRTATAR